MKKKILSMALTATMLFSVASPVLAFSESTKKINTTSDKGIVSYLGSYSTGHTDADGGVAEIVTYDRYEKTFYLVSGKTQSIDKVKINSDGSTKKLSNFDIKEVLKGTDIVPGDLTSVSYNANRKLLALAVQHSEYDENGYIVLLDRDGNFVHSFDAGVQPDMVTFSESGDYIITANEGEPREGYGEGLVDPDGSVTVVKLGDSIKKSTVKTIGFESITREDALANGALLRKDANPKEDFEPEYVAITDDERFAYVSLQENNAIGKLNLENLTWEFVKGLGFKDHSIVGNEIDIKRNETPIIDIRTKEGVFGVYMPDGISVVNINGKDYILTPNEGDAREWGKGEFEYVNIDSDHIGKKDGKKTEFLVKEKTEGLGNGEYYLLGGRSFSIIEGSNLEQVYDSGAEFEQNTARLLPNYFNATHAEDEGDPDELDRRSNKKGPEPESVETIKVGNKVYAIIGLERVGGIMVYDITSPGNAKYADYIDIRRFDNTGKLSFEEKGDLGPEGICTIEAEDSPTKKPLILVANEVSGTVSIFEFSKYVPVVDKTENYYPPVIIGGGFNMVTKPAEIKPAVKPVEQPVKKEYSLEEGLQKSTKTTFTIDNSDVKVVVDGTESTIKMDVTPIIENSRTLLPIRYAAYSIGAEVEYNKDSRTATFKSKGIQLKIQIDGNEAVVSDGRVITLDTKPVNINGRILVPISNIANIFGLTNGNTKDDVVQNIEWDESTRTVTVVK